MRGHSDNVAGSPHWNHHGSLVPFLLVQRAPAVQTPSELGLSDPLEDARLAETVDHVMSGARLLRLVLTSSIDLLTVTRLLLVCADRDERRKRFPGLDASFRRFIAQGV